MIRTGKAVYKQIFSDLWCTVGGFEQPCAYVCSNIQICIFLSCSVAAFSSRMSESAEALAANLTSRRNVTVEITNVTNNYCLIDPM